MESGKKINITVWQKIFLLLVSTTVSLTLVLLVGKYIPYGQSNLTQVLILKGWEAKTNIFGIPEIGIFKADPMYGWRMVPGATGDHFQPYAFDVNYTIDEEGYHITPGSYNDPKVLFLGGSFSFGHGVEDHENYVYLLGKQFPGLKMINASVMAWGTAHAWMELQRSLNKFDDIHVVVYGFINHHQHRNYLRQSWLDLVDSWDRRNPYFEMVNGEPVFQRLADPETDGIPDDANCAQKEREMTLLLIEKMKSLCAAKKIPFMIVHLPDALPEDGITEGLQKIVDDNHFLDLTKVLEYEQIKLEGDAHPSPAGHQEIARHISPFLKEKLNEYKHLVGLASD